MPALSDASRCHGKRADCSQSRSRSPATSAESREWSRHVTIIQYASLADEAAGIAYFAAELVNNQGYAPQDIRILAQRRSVGNPIHHALTGLNVPSKSYYQESVLDHASAQARLAILKLFIDPQDRIALRWILGYGSND